MTKEQLISLNRLRNRANEHAAALTTFAFEMRNDDAIPAGYAETAQTEAEQAQAVVEELDELISSLGA